MQDNGQNPGPDAGRTNGAPQPVVAGPGAGVRDRMARRPGHPFAVRRAGGTVVRRALRVPAGLGGEGAAREPGRRCGRSLGRVPRAPLDEHHPEDDDDDVPAGWTSLPPLRTQREEPQEFVTGSRSGRHADADHPDALDPAGQTQSWFDTASRAHPDHPEAHRVDDANRPQGDDVPQPSALSRPYVSQRPYGIPGQQSQPTSGPPADPYAPPSGQYAPSRADVPVRRHHPVHRSGGRRSAATAGRAAGSGPDPVRAGRLRVTGPAGGLRPARHRPAGR